ncbi:FAD dependent oxidoreductase [Lactarius psammicola]|nr:FAD dependent oxidoreductase [Lactarius psammicola]
MIGAAVLISALILPTFLHATLQGQPVANFDYGVTCEKIARSISSKSQVFYPGSSGFEVDIAHWTNSSSQISACSVEPGTPQDVGVVLRQVALTRTPFAVKGGGHTLNPGFSSTTGVHISLARFNDIVIHEDSETVEIGAGLTWLDVYSYLVPKGINVVGGRLGPVGVSGFILGGGYSFKTNQYGLTVDTVTEYELVLPNGRVKIVTEKDEDLWFALKGGLNNYGIITKFTLKSHKQPDIWAASLNFAGDLIEEAQVTFARFLTQEHDRRAAQLAQFIYSNGTIVFNLLLFYDGPKLSDGLYDELLNLTSTSRSITEDSFIHFFSSMSIPTFERKGYFDGLPILHITQPILEAFTNETKFWGERLSELDKNSLIIYSVDPFESDYLTHGGPSAYPPDRSRAVLPSNIYFGWSNQSADESMASAIRSSAASLIASGIRDGQDLENAATYVNYAMFGTPLEKIYGVHLELLREIRRKYDPDDVMYLTGGWKF